MIYLQSLVELVLAFLAISSTCNPYLMPLDAILEKKGVAYTGACFAKYFYCI